MGFSFRDPAGQLIATRSSVQRRVVPEAVDTLEAFLRTGLANRLSAEGALIGTRRGGDGLYEHDRIDFPSYPYEWPPEMLYAAGHLTLDFAEALLGEGFGLKDATPFNILFRGPKPVFVDVLSVEERDPHDPFWLAQAQFERTFLLPLLACADFAMTPAMIFLANREGLEPDQLYRSCSSLQKLRPGILWTVTVPTLLNRSTVTRKSGFYKPRRSGSVDLARYTLARTLRRLRDRLHSLEPRREASVWSGYGAAPESYTGEDARRKLEFVETALRDRKPATILDIGCNTGVYSLLAARSGATVVAIDRDQAVVSELSINARRENLDILSLVVDIARPSPATGWEELEGESFLNRCYDSPFDAVLMLALMHHIVVTERVPLSRVAALTSRLTRELALVEWVGPGDPMFQRLVRGREHLFREFSRQSFEDTFLPFFSIEGVCETGEDRRIYLFRRRQAC